MHYLTWEFHWSVISLSIKTATLHWNNSCFQYFVELLCNMYFEHPLECIYYVNSFHFDSYRIKKKYFITSKRHKNVYGIEQNLDSKPKCVATKAWVFSSGRYQSAHTCTFGMRYMLSEHSCVYLLRVRTHMHSGKPAGILLRDIRVEFREQKVTWSLAVWADVIICQQLCPLHTGSVHCAPDTPL